MRSVCVCCLVAVVVLGALLEQAEETPDPYAPGVVAAAECETPFYHGAGKIRIAGDRITGSFDTKSVFFENAQKWEVFIQETRIDPGNGWFDTLVTDGWQLHFEPKVKEGEKVGDELLWQEIRVTGPLPALVRVRINRTAPSGEVSTDVRLVRTVRRTSAAPTEHR